MIKHDIFVKTGDLECITKTIRNLTEQVWKYESSVSNINITIKDENLYEIFVIINNNVRLYVETELEILGFTIEEQIY